MEAAMVTADRRSHVPRRRWLPFRLPRLPLPGLGARPHPAPSHRHARGAKSSFKTASATVTVADCISSSTASGTAAGTATGQALAPPAATPHTTATVAAVPAKAATKPATDVIAGALARAASQSTIHPLDTMKVRAQAARRAPGVSKFGQLVPPAGASSAARAPAALDVRALGANVASLYRGVLGAASGAGIAIGAYFAFYGAAHNLVSRHTDLAPGAVAFVSGAAAAAGSSVVKVPLAVCIRSVQAGVYPNVFAAARAITAAAGTRGLFTGYFPTLLEDVPDMAVKFAAYESLRSLHRRVVCTDGRTASPHEDFAMGAVSGALAAAATTPLDVLKTRMMCAAASRPTMASAFRAVMAQGGARALFTGVGARSLSNGINSAVFFCFFEAIRGHMSGAAVLPRGAPAPARVALLRAAEELEADEEDDEYGSSELGGGQRMVLRVQALKGYDDTTATLFSEQ